jgi:glycosyltransferase involved in cell wall biosynthesis
MTVLQAMRAGTPVVVTSANGLADIVSEHGAGLAVRPDSSSLAQAVARIVESSGLARQMGEAGRALATDRFAISGVVDQLLEIYGRASSS